MGSVISMDLLVVYRYVARRESDKGLATVVDSMWEWIHILQDTQSKRTRRRKPVIQISILAFSLCFTPLTLECSSFRENPT